MPSVSIIVPAYNAAATIRRCVDSILAQTYADFELLVMDDGSTDETPQILDDLAAQDHRIRVVHKKNSGVSDTRNQALDLAQGEFIQFLDADDYLAPLTTEFYMHAMEDHPTCDMVISDFYRVIKDKRSEKSDISEEKLLTRLEYAQAMMRNPADFYYGVLWNKFYRRRIIEQYHVRMDTNLSWSEDFIFNMEYVLHAAYIYTLKYPTVYYVKTKGSLVSSQGASLAKTVQMKHAVIEYYTNFYKDIYKDGGYLLRTPAIYSYLLDSARDGGTRPGDGTLEEDPMKVRFASEMRDNPFVLAYYQQQLMKEMLHRLMAAAAHPLEEKEAAILLYLKLAGAPVPLMMIRNYTGLSQNAAASALRRLERLELVEKISVREQVAEQRREADQAARVGDPENLSEVGTIASASGQMQGTKEEIITSKGKQVQGVNEEIITSTGRQVQGTNVEKISSASRQMQETNTEKRQKLVPLYTLGDKSGAIQEIMAHIFRDTQEIELRGMSTQEQQIYQKLSRTATENIRRALLVRNTDAQEQASSS